MNERRINRIQALIKERVAEVIEHEISDPRRGLVTITRVKVDRDLATCIVYWSVIGDDAAIRTNARMLADAAGFVQREVGGVLHTRTVPRVKFVYDEGLVKAQNIEKILRELADERRQQEDGGEGRVDANGDAPDVDQGDG